MIVRDATVLFLARTSFPASNFFILQFRDTNQYPKGTMKSEAFFIFSLFAQRCL